MKQRCVSKQFMVINDKVKVDARVFISNISNNQSRGESKTAERQKERRESVLDRAQLEVKDSIDNKIDCWRETFGMNMCDQLASRSRCCSHNSHFLY